ncbi:DUF6624 domain-containing protein [Sphingobacterium corticibacter]|uniref:Uncharacterized protein n=1 Tax=Sphingobacterium corticibacter TaxID=2171749 RepID=A0A2T8HNS8_9SPHI|nr:DUF6624 domain-containing protein [Sphingobacterium corticibacter]PVH26962.1 hypothetical protein DC487_05045 [Sphingobacterium corticibacter]
MKIAVILLAFCLLQFTVRAQVTSFVIDEAQLDQSLKETLEAIYQSDQSVRMEIGQAKVAGKSDAYLDSLQQVVAETDQTNLHVIKEIIKKHGWVSPSQVGIQGAQGLFLVIQHADLETQETYLPMILEAEKQGDILSSNVAILLDRIAMRQGKKQKYGSQGFRDKESGQAYIYPIEDLDNLEAHRKSMGLPPMKDYVSGWDIEKYKAELPKIEEMVRLQSVK